MTLYISEKKSKKLKHVAVYDQLYELIQNNTYKEGEQLPSEPELAAQMNVSRMTLRKAIALLNEDGLVKNIRGKGNFITNPNIIEKNMEDKIENIIHPMYRYCTEKLDNVELEFRIDPPTPEILHRLKQKTPAVVIADRWYKQNSQPVSYSLTFMPIEQISKENLDLNNKKLLLQYLEKDVYNKNYKYKLVFSHSTTGNFTSSQYMLSKTESFLLIQENIINAEGKLVLSSKHYIPINLFRIELEF